MTDAHPRRTRALRIAAGTLGTVGLGLMIVDVVIVHVLLADTSAWIDLAVYAVGPALFGCGRWLHLRLARAEAAAMRVVEPE